MMPSTRLLAAILAVVLLAGFTATQATARVTVQCPGDTDGDAVIDTPDPLHPDAVCLHLAAGDGFVSMVDGREMYLFGFSDVTGTPADEVMEAGMLDAEFPAPTIKVREGQEVYLTLSNVGMVMRPDLFDPHTVHWHGFPNAAPVFDGEPMSSVSINMGSSITYYYRTPSPGTYMYHCHVEATEHMQMGMLGNLYVTPLQDELPNGTDLAGYTHLTGQKYAYNDGDGSTRYDVDFPIQISAFDPIFHEEHIAVQPLPFAAMHDTYPMLNGRGYPETLLEAELPNTQDGSPISQTRKMNALIKASWGNRILLRISSLSTVEYYTLATLGIPMTVVGRDAKLLRGPDGKNLAYDTNSVTLGGGQSVDVILDTTRIPAPVGDPAVAYLYTTNLNNLSNDRQDFGGMMTEIRVAPAP